MFETIDKIGNEEAKYLSAVFLLTQLQPHLEFFEQALANPSFKEYHIFFFSEVPDDIIRKLAELDKHDVVQNIQRIFCFYHSVSHDQFHCGLSSVQKIVELSFENWGPVEKEEMHLIEESLVSVLSSLRVLPQIRFQRQSEPALQLAHRVSQKMKSLNLSCRNEFDKTPAALLILERNDDLITPLLTHWSYQSLLHEILGLDGNKVTCNGEQYNMSLLNDEFYRQNQFSNYGEVATNLKTEVEKFQDKKKQMVIKNFDDMQKILSKMNFFQKDQSLVAKHINLVDALSKQVTERDLLSVSQVQ